ncbi:serine hydrolase [Urechidicola sp. KH5]
MKKFFKYFVLFLIIGCSVVVYQNYPRLNIITGYASKSTASVVYLANRPLESVESQDNNYAPVNQSSSSVNREEQSASSKVFGLKKRTAVYREGLGAVLVNDSYDANASYLIPNRTKETKPLPFPYGNMPQKDTIFENVDYKRLQAAVAATFDTIGGFDLKTRSFLVLYKDQIIAESYADGFDENSLHLGWSMTKSVMSTVYGVLNAQGKMDVDQRAPIAAWKNDERAEITISNLLQMNSGLEWEEDYGKISDVTKMLFLETDMTKTAIDKPLVGKPNESWYYSSGTSNLLSGILRNQFDSHQAYLDYWYTDFIDRIGMHSMTVEADLAGNYVASSYAWATARDWAKFGLLYLHNGNWNGDQVLTPEWITYATTPTNDSDGAYGAQFWLNDGGSLPDAPRGMYYADGYQGQRVYVIPSKELVIVRTGLANIDFNTVLKEVLASVK